MQFFSDLTQIQSSQPIILTIGTFDGLHLGHQVLLNQLKIAASAREALTAVLAFHPRPKTVLSPHLPSNDYLTMPNERIAMFEQFGLDILVMMPFTHELANLSASDFMRQVKKHLNLVELWAGHDFALGKNREGDRNYLANLGRELGYTVHEAAPCFVDGQIVSSTHIRHLLSAGEVSQATQLLGHYPAVSGQIVTGVQRGRTIGFPTANIAFSTERLLPADGVYATLLKRAGHEQRYPSVTNIGLRPSFVTGNKERTIEAHILDFNDDIYGEQCSLEFVAYLRPEQKFNHLAELVKQIKQDVEQAKLCLSYKMI